MSHPVQEEDRVGTAKIILTAVVSLAVFGVGALWSVAIQRDAQGGSIVQQAGNVGAAHRREPEVGIVYQWPFFISHYGQDKSEEKRAQLESYGWIDRDAKIVHIPIEQAMQKYVSEAGGAK